MSFNFRPCWSGGWVGQNVLEPALPLQLPDPDGAPQRGLEAESPEEDNP